MLITIFVALLFGVGISLYARGYSFDLKDKQLSPTGIFVIKSVPDGAEVLIDGELEIATNDSIKLPPGTYDINVRKEGYHPWEKRLTFIKEEVTEATAHLFKSAPSLSAITFSGALNPTPSDNFTKIAYAVPVTTNDSANGEGLWVMETVNLPIGFSRDPRQITDGDLTNASWEWSPDGRKILLTTKTGVYLLDVSDFTPQNTRVNITSTAPTIKEEWEEKRQKKLDSQIKSLPDQVFDVLNRKAHSVILSADEDMVLYTASGSATLDDDLIDPIPGASTQKQKREIKEGNTYVYDVKEDRNFLIDDQKVLIGNTPLGTATRRLSWFPTSRHLVLAEPEKITIMDYDGTNRVEVYIGSYEAPHAYPIANLDRLIILTNLGANSGAANLYSLGLK